VSQITDLLTKRRYVSVIKEKNMNSFFSVMMKIQNITLFDLKRNIFDEI
jgi:hypothetical protein